MLPAVFGALSFGASALSTVGGFMGQQSQAAASNKAAIEQYKQQQMIHHFDTVSRFAEYANKVGQYNQQLTYNKEAAASAYMAEDLRINELLKQEAFRQQDSAIKTAQAAGKNIASGQQGNSAARQLQAVYAAQGRNQAIGRASLMSASIAAQVNKDNVANKLKIANSNAFREVATTPVVGPVPMAPTLRTGPNPIGLVAGLGQSALSGFGAYQQALNW